LPPYQNGEVIYGFDGRLNSLSLVRLIVELETRVQDEMGHTVILTDNSVLSAKNSPFHDLDSLITFVEQKVTALEI